MEAQNRQQQKVLIVLLLINPLMFVVEMVLGIIAESTGLIADSMDMLADAMVYGVGLYAVGHTSLAKIRAATLSAYLQIGLGCMVMIDVSRRLILGSEPESLFMLMVGTVALLANITCLKLISKHRDGEVHMRASWVFSKNDVLTNLGVIVAGLLVYLSGSRLPDLFIGLLVSIVVVKGGIFILKDAQNELRSLEV